MTNMTFLQNRPPSGLQPESRNQVKARSGSPAGPFEIAVSEREFLPAALEVLHTPPSPVARALLIGICVLFAVAVGWSYFGWMDIYAVAQGKIQPIGRSKIVQPLEAGKVVAIRVHNGSRVMAGDVLVELDPTSLSADLAAQTGDLDSARAEAERRRVAIAAARTENIEAVNIRFSQAMDPAIAAREQSVLAADLGQLRASLATLRGQLAEKRATEQRLNSVIAARQKQLALAKERVDMREQLEPKGAGSRALTIEALQQYEHLITDDAGDRGQLVETEAAIKSLTRKEDESIAQFIADQSQKLAEAERKRDRLEQERIKAKWNANRTELKAPVDGTVQQLAVSTVGQVVSAGQAVLAVVPLDTPVEVEAMVPNRDVGFVEVGQPAVVKVDAFPFTRYGTIEGTVSRLSRDAVDDRSALELSDPVKAAAPQQGAAGSSGQSQNLVFPATIKLERQAVSVDGKDVPLTPGMTVSVEIKTGQRRLLDYLLSPLRELSSEAGRER